MAGAFAGWFGQCIILQTFRRRCLGHACRVYSNMCRLLPQDQAFGMEMGCTYCDNSIGLLLHYNRMHVLRIRIGAYARTGRRNERAVSGTRYTVHKFHLRPHLRAQRMFCQQTHPCISYNCMPFPGTVHGTRFNEFRLNAIKQL